MTRSVLVVAAAILFATGCGSSASPRADRSESAVPNSSTPSALTNATPDVTGADSTTTSPTLPPSTLPPAPAITGDTSPGGPPRGIQIDFHDFVAAVDPPSGQLEPVTVAVGGIVDVVLYDDARMGSWLPPISDQMGLIEVVTDIDCPSDAVCATFAATRPGVWLITATPPGHGPPTSDCPDCGSYALMQLRQNVIALG